MTESSDMIVRNRPCGIGALISAMLSLLLLFGSAGTASAQQLATAAANADGATIDQLVDALYEAISGPAGQPRDWDRLRPLFVPGARLIPTGKQADGTGVHLLWTLEEYIEQNSDLLVEIGFRESEIGRVTERFGEIAHVYSAYEAHREGEAEPIMRGVNSLQLWNDGSRWWIVNLMWQQESPDDPIPDRFLNVGLSLPGQGIVDQEAAVEVFGFIRPDGVVLPELARGPEGWTYVGPDTGFPAAEPSPWAQVTEYHLRMLDGTTQTLAAGPPVRICCNSQGNRHWAHSTSMSESAVTEYVPGGAIGYVVSNPEADAPFLPTSRELPSAVEQLADSLSPLPDSRGIRTTTQVWRANLDGSIHTFFQLEQAGRGDYIGCFVMAGWLAEDDLESFTVVSSGWDDCEGKGHGHRRPWAILRREGALLAAVAFYNYSDSRVELWRHRSGQDWELFFDPRSTMLHGR